MIQTNLVGRMANDPEDINGGGVKFRVACDEYNASTKTREAVFIPCVAFGNVVQTIKQYAPKGKEVRVTGPIRLRTYTATNGVHAGHDVNDFSIFVDEFELLAGQPANRAPAPAPEPDAPETTGGW